MRCSPFLGDSFEYKQADLLFNTLPHDNLLKFRGCEKLLGKRSVEISEGVPREQVEVGEPVCEQQQERSLLRCCERCEQDADTSSHEAVASIWSDLRSR